MMHPAALAKREISVVAFRAMDDSELRSQLERHHADSYDWAVACCSQNRELAEGILQTAYLKILQGSARYRGEAAFKTWLYAVIRLTAADGVAVDQQA